MIVGKCIQCGEELRVPSHLEQFSCMYCGQKLSQSDITKPQIPLEGDSDALMAAVLANIAKCVINYRESRSCITKAAYFPFFEDMEAFCAPIFKDLDMACALEPSSRNALLEQAVNTLLNGLEADWATNRKPKLVLDDDKMTIAIFLVPMVGKMKLAISQDFNRMLHENWMARHPKNAFLIGDYDDIAEGFRKKFKLCFITTAVCESRGLPDDCAQLTAFRQFRDGYLMSQPEGTALVAEYYDIAPGIVTCIDHCADRSARYEAIGQDFLDPCYAQLQAGKLADCQQTYTAMVQSLRKTYCN